MKVEEYWSVFFSPGFEREVQKQPGSMRGAAQSAVSTNAHGTYTGLGGKKINRHSLFVVT